MCLFECVTVSNTGGREGGCKEVSGEFIWDPLLNI